MIRITPTTLSCCLALLLLTTSARADNITITATADGTINDATGDGIWDTVNTTGPSITIRQFGAGIVADRSVVAFNLATLPAGATVTSVSFTFNTVAFTSPPPRPVAIHGYTGNGTVTISDATAASTLLTSYDAANLGLGAHTVSLGASGIAALNAAKGSSGFLELRLQGGAGATNINTSLASLESGNPPLPQLQIVTAAVPEPATLAAVGAGIAALAGLYWRHRRRHALSAELPELVEAAE